MNACHLLFLCRMSYTSLIFVKLNLDHDADIPHNMKTYSFTQMMIHRRGGWWTWMTGDV